MSQTKLCPTCSETKSVGAFWSDRNKPDGHRHECADCSNRTRREGGKKREPKPFYAVEDHGYATACWQWQRAKTLKEYGTISFKVDGVQRWMPAHRYFYQQAKDPIPEGYQIDHLCRNHSCVNPEHLEAVTQAENMRRGANTRLTHLKVAEIRASTESHAALALRFGVSAGHVAEIRAGRHWGPDKRTNRLAAAA